MPKFPNPEEIRKIIPSREEAIAAILASIAAEETALGRVISAESEKIKLATECAKCGSEDMCTLLAVNKSAAALIAQVTDMQIVLKNKMALALEHLPKPPCPPCPPCPPRPPKPHCVREFIAQTEFAWTRGTTLFFEEECGRRNGARLSNIQCESRIIFPACQSYDIMLDLELFNPKFCPLALEIVYRNGAEIIRREEITSEEFSPSGNMKLSYSKQLSASKQKYLENSMAIYLVSPNRIKIAKGTCKFSVVNG